MVLASFDRGPLGRFNEAAAAGVAAVVAVVGAAAAAVAAKDGGGRVGVEAVVGVGVAFAPLFLS